MQAYEMSVPFAEAPKQCDEPMLDYMSDDMLDEPRDPVFDYGAEFDDSDEEGGLGEPANNLALNIS